MNRFEVEYFVNNMRTKQVVTANSDSDARKIITSMHPGAKIVIYFVRRV